MDKPVTRCSSSGKLHHVRWCFFGFMSHIISMLFIGTILLKSFAKQKQLDARQHNTSCHTVKWFFHWALT